MRKTWFRKCAAIGAVCAMLVTALPVSQMSASAADLISNGTFEGGTSGWGMYKESGGACTLNSENGRLALKVSNVGKVTYAVQMFYDIIPLYQNGVYRLKYDISSTTDRFVEGMIQQNGGTYQAYTWKGLDISSTPTTVDYTFTMEAETDIMAKLVFNCGLQEKSGELPEHTIYLDNVSLELVDDSKVDYSASRPYAPPILTNQVGYQSGANKTAVFRNAGNASSFSVINADTKQTVFTGNLSGEINNSSANEVNKTGDFSSVTAPGNYYIHCDGLDDSYTFRIDENPYGNLLNDSVKMLYLQRCGCQVNDPVFGHGACHNTMATIYGTNQQIDVSGGWHDAGDYGRYVVPAAKAVADLMLAYKANPDLYTDNIGIAESGNGKADVLDEAKYELDWMLKMQDANSGGVYHKVTCENFPGYVAPEKETAPLIVTPISTTSTADFAAAMALAAEVYRDYDSAYADKCLNAAKKAWTFLEQNPNFIFKNPEDITTGDYGDKSDTDERYWAAAQLYRTTKDEKYLNALQSMPAQDGMDWALVGDYGNIALLTMPDIDTNSQAYQTAKSKVLKQADLFLKNSQASPYGVSQTVFNWGSNMTVANSGLILSLASQLTGEQKYQDAATAQLNYLLGTNPLGTCFVTGYGTVSPEHPHHRPSMAAGQAMKGMLVGGVNYRLEDSAAKAYCNGLAPALCYVDNSESYSTNEITIYWNSPLTYLMTLTDTSSSSTVTPTSPTEEPTEATQPTEVTEPTQPTEATEPSSPISGNRLYGDVNLDGKVNVIDVVTINRAILNMETLNAEQLINGDVNMNQKPDSEDSLLIMKFALNLIDKFPASSVTPPVQPATEQTEPQVQPTEQPTTPTVNNGITDYGTPMNSSATAVADFRQGATPLFFASDGWTNGDCFDCGWYGSNAVLSEGRLNLTIDKDYTGKYHYSAAEYRTADFYHYGHYETSMQAIKNDGVVSSFFTYTGISDNNPWDEIDIEILGKDTTKVQFNYYTDGTGKHEVMYDLGFDASEGYHTYGFDWQPDHITWYVDGKAVYTATDNIPKTPGKIMMNVWPGIGVDGWLNPFNGNTPLTARYQWVTYNK